MFVRAGPMYDHELTCPLTLEFLLTERYAPHDGPHHVHAAGQRDLPVYVMEQP